RSSLSFYNLCDRLTSTFELTVFASLGQSFSSHQYRQRTPEQPVNFRFRSALPQRVERPPRFTPFEPEPNQRTQRLSVRLCFEPLCFDVRFSEFLARPRGVVCLA